MSVVPDDREGMDFSAVWAGWWAGRVLASFALLVAIQLFADMGFPTSEVGFWTTAFLAVVLSPALKLP